jgi:HPt (histidine-containing phosphotransfer) domain-containing protein
MSKPEAVEFSEILERLRDLGMADDPAFEAEILGDFLADSERILAGLAAAIASNDAAECEKLAHRLKGASQNLGANALSEPALVLEKMSRGGSLADARASQETLATEFERVRLFIEGYIRTLQKSE